MSTKIQFETINPTKLVVNLPPNSGQTPEFHLEFVVFNGEASDPNDIIEDVNIKTKKTAIDNAYEIYVSGSLYNFSGSPVIDACTSGVDDLEGMIIPMFSAALNGEKVDIVSASFGDLRVISSEDIED